MGKDWLSDEEIYKDLLKLQSKIQEDVNNLGKEEATSNLDNFLLQQKLRLMKLDIVSEKHSEEFNNLKLKHKEIMQTLKNDNAKLKEEIEKRKKKL